MKHSFFPLVCLVFLLGWSSGGHGQTVVDELGTITLSTTLHFLSPTDEDVTVPPGTYTITVEEEGMRLNAGIESQSYLIRAQEGTHVEDLNIGQEDLNLPGVILIPGEQDVQYLTYAFPSGEILEAVGSTSGVVSRRVIPGKLKSSRKYCATKPPPQGLVKRCQSLKLVRIPDSIHELRGYLKDWMASCATKSRAGKLVDDPSVEHVWNLLAPQRGNMLIGNPTIIPKYTPLRFTENGRTCYGIDKVQFAIRGAQGQVDLEGPIEIINPETDDKTIKKAAATAIEALKKAPGPGSIERSKMLSVLHWMKTYGKDFDDTYYPVAPPQQGNSMRIPPIGACYVSDTPPFGYLPSDEALKGCTSRLTPWVVKEYLRGASQKAFGDFLLSIGNNIRRGIDHLHQIQANAVTAGGTSDGVMTLFRQRESRAKNPKSLYYAWDK